MRSRITTTTTTITTGIFFGGKSKRSACVLGPIEGRRTAHGEVSRPRLRSDPHRAHSPTSRARRLCFVCLSRPVFLLLLRRNFLSPPPVSSLSCLDEKQQLVLILFVHVRNKRELERMDLFDGWNSKNLISLILNLYYTRGARIFGKLILRGSKVFFFFFFFQWNRKVIERTRFISIREYVKSTWIRVNEVLLRTFPRRYFL